MSLFTALQKRLQLQVIIAVYVLLALIYVYAVPVYEAPDELYHFGMVDHVARTWSLPVQIPDFEASGPWKQEGSQPPLYYLITAAIVSPFDRSSYPEISQLNPHANVGYPTLIGNKNHVLHAQVYPPLLTGAHVATYAARLFSIFCGCVTIFAVHRTARTLTPDRPQVATVAAILTAFNPQFVFISATVNNDNLVTALMSLTLWQVMILLRDGFQTRRSLILAVLIALATLSKLSGLVAVLITALAGLWLFARTRDLRGLFTLGISMIVIWAVLAGWWYARNLTLYGELFGTNRMIEVIGARPEPLTFPALLVELSSLVISYWGIFGWFNILTSNAYYVLVGLVMLAGVAGFGVALWRTRHQVTLITQYVFLLLTLTAGFGAFVSWTLQTYATQGRLLFPYIAATSTLLAVGLRTWRLPPLSGVILAGAALIFPFTTIMPEYRPPAALDALPASATPTDYTFGEIKLAGIEIAPGRYTSGEIIPLTLYWQPLAASPVDYSMYVHLINVESGEVIAKIDSFPALGRLQTTHWQAGGIYPDVLYLPVGDWRDDFPLSINVGWWHRPTEQYLIPIDGAGQSMLLSFAAGVNKGAPARIEADSLTLIEPVDFDGVIRLLGYHLEADGALTLLWEAASDIPEDYVVLVQAMEAPYGSGGDAVIVAQDDRAPDIPTRYWRPGEQYLTRHQLVLRDGVVAAGEYPVYVGWYSLNRPYRMSTSAPDGMYPLAMLGE